MNKGNIPDFYGVLEVQHYIEGRIRLKARTLIENHEGCEKLVETLKSINGIYEIGANALTGSILIKFDENIISPMLLIQVILRVLGLEDEAFAPKVGAISSMVKGTVEAVDHVIYNKTKGILDSKTVLGLLLLGYGVKKIRTERMLPNGVNMLWWAYTLFTKGDR